MKFNPEKDKNPRIIVVNGDVCSGSSTLAGQIADELDYELIDVGQMFRQEMLRSSHEDANEISIALNGLIMQHIAADREKVIEGRLVGVQAKNFSGVLKLLCLATSEVRVERYMNREGLSSLEDASLAMRNRHEIDRRLLHETWDLSLDQIFNPILYDEIIDTSHQSPCEIIRSLEVRGYF